MRIGALEGDGKAALFEALGEGNAVRHHLSLQLTELVCLGDLECRRHGGEYVDMRPTLLTGEYGTVDLARQQAVGGHDDGAARPVECLMGCG